MQSAVESEWRIREHKQERWWKCLIQPRANWGAGEFGNVGLLCCIYLQVDFTQGVWSSSQEAPEINKRMGQNLNSTR